MRVMVIGPMEADSFADNIAHTLRSMGHVVATPGAAPRSLSNRHLDLATAVISERSPRLVARRQWHVVRRAREFRPDLTISVDRRLSAEVVSQLHDLGGPVYLWFPDHVANLGKHDSFLVGYDRIYLKNPVLAHRLHSIQGLPVHYLPEACNPHWHRSAAPHGTTDQVALVGNVHPTRAVLLSRLVEAGVPLAVYGSSIAPWIGHPDLGPVHTGRIVRRQDKANVFRSATAVLNNLHPAEFGGTNCRLFEATCAGGLVLTEQREGLGDLFEVGREVLSFSSFDELTDLLRRAQSDPSWAAAIADAGAARSLREHTYEVRLTTMLAS